MFRVLMNVDVVLKECFSGVELFSFLMRKNLKEKSDPISSGGFQ